MRDIKFRVWSPGNKSMHSAPYIYKGEVYTWGHDGMVPWYSEDQIKLHGVPVLMQYTGLQDKNGVEIYEGDIVSSYYPNAVVFFSGGSFMTYIDKGLFIELSQNGLFDTSGNNIYYEVIGNIHQNPDLLDD